MVPDAFAAEDRYGELAMPVAIVAGDEVVDTADQARRFHRENPRSRLHAVEGCGHTVHHTAPIRLMPAAEELAQAA